MKGKGLAKHKKYVPTKPEEKNPRIDDFVSGYPDSYSPLKGFNC